MNKQAVRDVVFISKATPGDDEFATWLAARLESAGFKVFADILNLQPGDRWRKEITATLQERAAKMLLCCQDSTLERNGVQEEIAIAEDLAKQLKDPRFIVPMRLRSFKKLFGIGGLQYINFEGAWAEGLQQLLKFLVSEGVPRGQEKINPGWEAYRQRNAIQIQKAPEELVSNWLAITEIPDKITFYEATGALDHSALHHHCKLLQFPAVPFNRGFATFLKVDEVKELYGTVGKFEVHSQHELLSFIQCGDQSLGILAREASNMVSSMFRAAWENFCKTKALQQYAYSNSVGFHASAKLVEIGKKVVWDRARKRSSMLRNIANGMIWQYGVSAIPSFWPYPHFRLKSRVLFAEIDNCKVFDDCDQQHSLRRTMCKGWRNKEWHGRLRAFVQLLASGGNTLDLPLSPTSMLVLDADPIRFTAPVTTILPQSSAEDDEAEMENLRVVGE